MRSSAHRLNSAQPLEGESGRFDRKQPRARWLALCVGALLAVLLVEAMARISLWVTRGDSTIGLPERTLYLRYRPFLMFGPDWDATLGKLRRSLQDGRYRVLLLGASTAEGFPPHVLEEELAKRFSGREFEVVSAAYGGYNARQELILASLWGPELRPDMILSLDGANDLRHRIETERAGTFFLDPAYALALEDPWLAPIADLARHSQALQGVRRLAARWKIESAERYADAIPIYVSAEHGINVLAKGMGSARVMVLQPFLGFKEPPSAEEDRFTAYRYREDVMKQLYERTSQELTKLAAQDSVTYLDGRFAFRGVFQTVFSDDVHFTSEDAYRRLASWIAASLPGDAVNQ
jgi:hypothetical protein